MEFKDEKPYISTDNYNTEEIRKLNIDDLENMSLEIEKQNQSQKSLLKSPQLYRQVNFSFSSK